MTRRPDPETVVLAASREGIDAAARYLRAGELVAFPTETVYGLGADATNPDAVRSVFEAKGRPRTDPLIVHVSDISMAETLGDLDAGHGTARRLAEAFWPGPLTVVVPRAPLATSPAPTGNAGGPGGPGGIDGGGLRLAPEVSMGPTVGLRCPANQIALDLIDAVGVPVAAPSANRFGRVSPTTAAHVVSELDGRIRAVLDGGPTTLGVESTVVAFDGAVLRVLRPGGVTVEDLREALPGATVLEHTGLEHTATGPAATVTAGAAEPLESPGTSVSHYAPEVPVVFTARDGDVAHAIVAALRDRGLGVRLIELGEPFEAARTLYPVLRSLDEATDPGGPPDVAVVAAVEPVGLGRAVNDRLLRAAHGHMRSDAEPSTIDAIVDAIGGRFG